MPPLRDKQHSCGRRDRLRGPDRAGEWSGFGTRTRGDPSSAGRESPSGRRDPPRFHNASTTSFDTCPSADAMTNIPLRKRRRGDGRCPARTGALLLVRREHLLRSTARPALELPLAPRRERGPAAAAGPEPAAASELLVRLASSSAAPPLRDLAARLRAEVHGGEHPALADRALRRHRADLAREAARVVVRLDARDLAVLHPDHVAALDVHLLACRREALEAARAAEGAGRLPANRGAVVLHD